MAKEVMIVDAAEIPSVLKASDAAIEAYKFAIAHAGIEMDEDSIADFVVRRNEKSGWVDLWELKAWCEKTAASIKEMAKHSFNVGTEEQLPRFVKWSKQSFTAEFQPGAGAIVIDSLIKRKLVNKDDIYNAVTVSALVKASGLTMDKLEGMFPDTILQKPKERTLSIK